MARRRAPAARAGVARRRGRLRDAGAHRRQRLGAARRGQGDAAPVADLPAEAVPLFEKLRTWRTGVAREQGMPPYVIFHDATLRAIAALNPTTLQQLATVNGVGENKLAKFGQQVLDALSG